VYTPGVNPKRLSLFINNINLIKRTGTGDPIIGSLVYDSREVRPGSLFFALSGVHTDGHQYVSQALDRGALAVVHSLPLSDYSPGIVYLQVEDTRKTLSPLSSAFYNNPSKDLFVLGVTGTDGKSTTVYMIQQLLEKAGVRAGFLSTVQFKAGEEISSNPYRQSTPEAPEIHSLLSQMRDSGKRFAVLEATSHGLSERNSRLADVLFSAGVLTNITHEHLEFHGSFSQYRSDKTNLFRYLAKAPQSNNPFGVINRKDPSADYVLSACPVPIYTYGMEDPTGIDPKIPQPAGSVWADLIAREVKSSPEGSKFLLSYKGQDIPAFLSMPGLFNVENLLAALLSASQALRVSPLELTPYIPDLRPVKGRLSPVKRGQDFSVIVDYAHTPGAFAKLFPFLKSQSRGRLIALFGSAGERDIEKRSIQGKIASEYADILVLSDEDPRGENPLQILKDIAEGCENRRNNENLFLIPDRREGIRKALSLAEPGDMVVFLGKGHESSIIYSAGKIPWDEEAEVTLALQELGF